MDNPPKKILVSSVIFSALMMNLPALAAGTQPIMTKSINGFVHTIDLSADKIQADIDLLSQTTAHPMMVTRATIKFNDLNEKTMDKIFDALAETEFDEGLLDDTRGKAVIFELADDNGNHLPTGGITIDSVKLTAPELAKVMQAITNLPPSNGKTNLWAEFEANLPLTEAA